MEITSVKGQHEGFCSDENAQYLDHICVDDLIVIVHYCFPRCSIRGNEVKGPQDFSVLFLTIVCESAIM